MNYKLIMNKMMMIPIPLNINYMWNMGSLMLLNFFIQFISGIMLVMYYNTENSFNSVIFIMRETNYGWLMRLIHMNMASLYFLIMYIHISRSMFYNSFSKKTWNIGVLILLISTVTAFLGYTLPWGQMSYWAATVITNLITSLPYFKMMIVEWIWGNFNINKLTLTRFFSLHFILPFMIMLLLLFHIMSLHMTGSSNPMGLMKNNDKINFNPYFLWKDYLGFMLLLLLMMLIMIIAPYLLSNPENMLMSNPLVTPIHIEPEWYFLYAYSILRTIPNKMGGTLMMLMSIIILFIVPYLYKNIINNSKFYPINKFLSYSFFINFINLTLMGMMEMKSLFELMSKLFTFFYFAYFFMNYLIFKMWNYLIY